MAQGVFAGLKVLDFSWAAVGPVMTRYLATHGATVVRVESSVHPDVLRTSPPFKDGKSGLDRSADFSVLSPNKLSMAVNLNHAEGIALVKKLVAWADVVVENFSPGVMKRWGLSYEEIKQIKPDIIMVSSSALGQTGPHAHHPGHGGALVSLSGFTNLTGWGDGEPNQPFGAYTDFIAPHFGAAALLAALDYRRRAGAGQHIDVSQFEAGLQYMAPHVLDYLINEREGQRMGNHSPEAAPHGAYRCLGDDRWCAIAVETEAEWRSLCQVLGQPSWCRDPRFATFEARKANEDELDRLVEAWTCQRTAEEVMESLQRAGVAAGVVQSAADVCTDPQLQHRRYFQVIDHPEVGPHQYQASPFILSRSPGELKRSPLIGEHNELVCREILGLSEEEYIELLVDGVLQ